MDKSGSGSYGSLLLSPGSWCAQGLFEFSERLQDGWVMVENSDKTWSPEEGNGKPLQYSCLENPHGYKSLACYSPRGRKELDTTEQLSTARHCILDFFVDYEGYSICSKGFLPAVVDIKVI